MELSSVIRNMVAVFKEKAMVSRGVNVVFDTSGDMMVLADEKRIKQVISNILENALRHSQDNGLIEVIVSKVDSKNAKVSIRDTGDGIDPADAPKLFDSFSQIGEKGKVGRLGLGLSISKDIVINHGGKIWAESEGRGKGTAFSFTLPLINN